MFWISSRSSQSVRGSTDTVVTEGRKAPSSTVLYAHRKIPKSSCMILCLNSRLTSQIVEVLMLKVPVLIQELSSPTPPKFKETQDHLSVNHTMDVQFTPERGESLTATVSHVLFNILEAGRVKIQPHRELPPF